MIIVVDDRPFPLRWDQFLGSRRKAQMMDWHEFFIFGHLLAARAQSGKHARLATFGPPVPSGSAIGLLAHEEDNQHKRQDAVLKQISSDICAFEHNVDTGQLTAAPCSQSIL